MPEEFELGQLAEPLQAWFGGHARVLPWRENPTPYYVWISEIMLQQTRVEAVKPYFERFIRELPDVRALAECSEERLLKLWEGLGYYNRARNLKTAAEQVMERHGGVIPSDVDALLALKGIGRYTAGAVASIAYKKPVPAVDGNVLRVISRVTADDSDIAKQSVRARVEERLAALMEEGAAQGTLFPQIFNQALMELGATVCLPNGEPRCGECPWGAFCEARRQGRIAELPVKKRPKERRIEERTVLIVRDGERVAIHRRPARGLLAGLYELPNCEGYLTQGEALSYLKERGLLPIRILPLSDAKHIFSHVEWHMKGYAVLVEEPGERSGEWLFVEAQDARERYAIPAAFAKYAAYLNIPVGKDSFAGTQ